MDDMDLVPKYADEGILRLVCVADSDAESGENGDRHAPDAAFPAGEMSVTASISAIVQANRRVYR